MHIRAHRTAPRPATCAHVNAAKESPPRPGRRRAHETTEGTLAKADALARTKCLSAILSAKPRPARVRCRNANRSVPSWTSPLYATGTTVRCRLMAAAATVRAGIPNLCASRSRAQVSAAARSARRGSGLWGLTVPCRSLIVIMIVIVLAQAKGVSRRPRSGPRPDRLAAGAADGRDGGPAGFFESLRRFCLGGCSSTGAGTGFNEGSAPPATGLWCCGSPSSARASSSPPPAASRMSSLPVARLRRLSRPAARPLTAREPCPRSCPGLSSKTGQASVFGSPVLSSKPLSYEAPNRT